MEKLPMPLHAADWLHAVLRQRLTFCCSYCGTPSLWATWQDGREYCPAHLFIAQLKTLWWATHAHESE